MHGAQVRLRGTEPPPKEGFVCVGEGDKMKRLSKGFEKAVVVIMLRMIMGGRIKTGKVF